jgi:hypothetical protein
VIGWLRSSYWARLFLFRCPVCKVRLCPVYAVYGEDEPPTTGWHLMHGRFYRKVK